MQRVRVNAPHLKSHGKTGVIVRDMYYSTGLAGVRLDDGQHISISRWNLNFIDSSHVPAFRPGEKHLAVIYAQPLGDNSPKTIEEAARIISSHSYEPCGVLYGTFCEVKDYVKDCVEGDVFDFTEEKCFVIWNEMVFSVEVTTHVKLTG